MSKLWCDKHKPLKIKDCILPENLKTQFKNIIENKDIPNMMFFGKSGVGKTATARVLCEELDIDWMIINISEESGIDTLRTKIRDFASTVSLSDNGKKCVILDEFDYASQNLQAGLRGFIEDFSGVCSFIMTCNFKQKIMDALHSRTVSVDFSFSYEEEQELKKQILSKLNKIIKLEGKTAKQNDLKYIINEFFPDNRKIINETQQYIELDKQHFKKQETIVKKDNEIQKIIDYIKVKDYENIIKWSKKNQSLNFKNVYTVLYNSMSSYINKKSIPDAIILLEEYQRHHMNSLNKEIHICALFTRMANELEFIT